MTTTFASPPACEMGDAHRPDLFRLDDKVVLITGASSGLGVAFAQSCADAGADVVVAARRVDRLEATVGIVEEAGRIGVAVAADVSDADDSRRIVAAAVQRFGRIDVLVNNAGIEDHDRPPGCRRISSSG